MPDREFDGPDEARCMLASRPTYHGKVGREYSERAVSVNVSFTAPPVPHCDKVSVADLSDMSKKKERPRELLPQPFRNRCNRSDFSRL